MAVRERYFDDFVKLPCMVLISVGYDYLEKPRSLLLKVLMILYFVLSMFCCLYCTYIVGNEILKVIMAGIPDLLILLRLFGDLNFNNVGILKSLCFVRNVKGQKKLFKQLKKIFPKTSHDRLAYQVNENYWPRWVTLWLYLYFGAVAFILFIPLLTSFAEYASDFIHVGYDQANFTYHKMYEEQIYVMDHHNPFGYFVIYSMETMNCHYALAFNVGPDIWLVAFAMQLCMHFSYISRSLEAHEPDEGYSEKDTKFIAYIVQKHQLLLKFADDMRDSFSSLVLVMLFSTAASLCCSGIYMMSKGLTSEFFGYFAFFSTSMGQYYIVCYYGQEIINKSSEVANAVYNQAWYNGGNSYKKSMLSIIGRAQRQCEINAGGFHTINLESFKQVLSMSFQLYTVTRTVFDPEEW